MRKDIDTEGLRDKLRDYMRKHCITWRELERRFDKNITYTTLQRFLNGSDIRIDALLKVERFLRVEEEKNGDR